MVFDYAEHDLTGMIDAYKDKLSVPQVKCIMMQLLMGLSYCHMNGVLHRDLKAANILITREGVLKLADFGLARTFLDGGGGKMTNRVITLWYRPPELLLGAETYGPAVDVWSAGCIFAELLSGKPLFPGRDEHDTLRRILELMGYPTAGGPVWPGVGELPFYREVAATGLKPDSDEGFSHWCQNNLIDKDAAPLLKRMLALDPAKRVDAKDALLDPYFLGRAPAPCKADELPRLPDSHEFTTKRSRRAAGGAQGQGQGQQQQHARGGGGYAPHHHPQQQQQQQPYYAAGAPPAAAAAAAPYDRNVRPRTGGYPGGGVGGAPSAPYAVPAAPGAPAAQAPQRGAGRGFVPSGSQQHSYGSGGTMAPGQPRPGGSGSYGR